MLTILYTYNLCTAIYYFYLKKKEIGGEIELMCIFYDKKLRMSY